MNTTLLSKYDVAAPRYTSYPTVPYWSEPLSAPADWLLHVRSALQADAGDHQLVTVFTVGVPAARHQHDTGHQHQQGSAYSGYGFHEGPVPLRPLVKTHPDTGRKCLYISDQMTDHFDGWTVAESKPLIDYLCKQIEHPAFTYRHRWESGDVIMWDNRCTQHYAPLDYDFAGKDKPENHRLMFRSTLA